MSTAQTSAAAIPEIAASGCRSCDVTGDNALPFQCTTAPLSPTAHTSFAATPQTPFIRFVVAVNGHVTPLLCSMPPAPPLTPESAAIQISLFPDAQTPVR